MVGRLKMTSRHNMHPWTHIMAAVTVCEHIARRTHLSPHKDACYILDIGELDFNGTYSAVGGAVEDEVLFSGPSRAERGACREPPEGREFLLQQHGELYPGLSVLRCAIDILNAHYPELLYKVHG